MVGQVQEHLEAIYAIESELRASEFLVDGEAAKALGGTGRSGEELLVRQEGDELELALYLDPKLLARLQRYEGAPTPMIVERELDSYCQVAEGVSHFLYLTHTAQQERRVSLLELEAQAEIDKFATCVLHGWKRGVAWAELLLARIFERVRYLSTLTAQERWRYEEANRLSHQYCRRLLKHVANGQLERFLSDLRYCYRLGAEAKLRHLAQAA